MQCCPIGVGAVSTIGLQPSEPSHFVHYYEMEAPLVPTWSPWHCCQCAPGDMLGVSRARSARHLYRKDHGGRSLRHVWVYARGSGFLRQFSHWETQEHSEQSFHSMDEHHHSTMEKIGGELTKINQGILQLQTPNLPIRIWIDVEFRNQNRPHFFRFCWYKMIA